MSSSHQSLIPSTRSCKISTRSGVKRTMKNDVVRWSPRNPVTDSDNNSDQSINKSNSDFNNSCKSNCKHTSRQLVTTSNIFARQHVAPRNSASTPRQQQQQQHHHQQQQHLQLNCDSKIVHANSFLAHARKRKSHRNVAGSPCGECSRRSRHSLMQCARHVGSNSRAIRNKLGLFCLQLSVVVILCTYNIGFALAVSSNDIAPTADELLYQLDYENAISDNEISRSGTSGGHYTHTWAVHIPNGDSGLADDVARDHGFVNLGKIFDDHYHFAHHKVSKRSLSPSTTHQTRLDEDNRVHWAKQQQAKSRQKRDFIRMRPSRTSSRSLSLVDAVSFSDPKWSQMWYLNRGGGLDMNVIPAWKEGITGKGVVVTILDDGLESNHPDIEHNYDPKASYDVNSHDEDPMPHYDMTDSNRHGTRCAGEVAATANNSICAVGIAFGASVGGVRMLDGDVTDAVEARSLSLNPQHIDIYSASWGPDDDGKTVDGPGELASRAFIEGVTKGRNGKGSIFIWASGNGGRELDNCNCDGYTNSIWTLSISSATEEGHVPWYSEKCSSTLATTYSSGGQTEKQVVTTDLHHSCTVSHTGTSASAPLAAGIAALVLESNRNLTWRDLQHIVVRTAKPANLKDPTWSKNGIGRRISHSFGYGLMDAASMVKVARTWKTVPEQQRCEINAPHVDKVIPSKGSITLQLTVKHCSSVNYLEHVQAKITLTSQRRGDIQLYLKSPAGTKVTLLTSRVHDVSRSGFNQWPFMSVHTWGESPHGNWQLEIHNEGRYMGHALLREWSLIFYGTTQPIDPNDPISTPRAPASIEITTPNSSATSSTTSLHQVYPPQYPRISPNNFGAGSTSNGGKTPGKASPNKSVYIASGSTNNPLLGFPISTASNGGNKKQQQQQQIQQQLKQQQQSAYQQISATYGLILSPQGGKSNKANNNNKNKNNKNDKNDNNNNNNNNKGTNKASNNSGNAGGNNGKTGASKKDPSNSAKNKFYRISQQQNNNKSNNRNNANTSNQRMKAQSAEKLQSFEDKTNRKVIGDLPININAKTPLKSASQTTSYAKLPVKATKQVKDNTAALPIAAQTHERMTAIATMTDQRIPKLFERYEKIQAIFPEFQPYLGPNRKEATMLTATTTTTSDKRKQVSSNFEVETFKPIISTAITGSKPSRENSNSKKSPPSFTPNQAIIKKQQLLLAAAGVSGGTQRPLLVGATPNRKSNNAQITQWDLIFYGTEAPAQPDDPVYSNPGQTNPSTNDMDHNDIENVATGQWRNMKQIGASDMMPEDRTSTACHKVTSDQRCLECTPPSYLFDGHCYDECPPHSYPLSTMDEPLSANPVDNELHDNDVNSMEDAGEQLQSTNRKRRAYDEADEMLHGYSPRSCAICDASCLRCYGPLNSQCSTCAPGSQLRKVPQKNETFCYVFAERSSGNSQDSNRKNDAAAESAQTKSHSNAALVVLVVVPTLMLISLVVFMSSVGRAFNAPFFRRNIDRSGNAATSTVNYAYDRVALLPGAEGESESFNTAASTAVVNLPEDSSDSEEECYVRTK